MQHNEPSYIHTSAPATDDRATDLTANLHSVFDALVATIDTLNKRVAALEAGAVGMPRRTWYSRADAAAYLSISISKLHDLRHSGRLTCHLIDGKPVFHVDDLDALAVIEGAA